MRTGGYTPPVLSVSSRHDLQSMLFYNVVCVIVSNASSLYFLRESLSLLITPIGWRTVISISPPGTYLPPSISSF